MRILITGGTGFIGARLGIFWLERGHSVAVLGQENNAAETRNRRMVEAKGGHVSLSSVTDRSRVFEIVQGAEVVYHLAAAQHEANIPDQIFWDVNVEGTQNLLDASVAAGVKKFVYGSTIGVYGASLQGRLDEDSPVKPDNIYGVTKLEAEKRVLAQRERLPVVAIRISETYGPGDQRLLKLFKGIQKGVFFIIGSGENIHHLIYIDDLVQGFYLAATVDKASGKVIVLSGKEALSTAAMAQIIAAELGKKLSRLRLPLPPFLALAALTESVCRPLGVQPPLHRRRMDFFRKGYLFSQERSLKILGFVPQVGFSPGVAKTAAWYREMGYL